MHATLHRSQIMSAAAPSVSGVIAYVVTVSTDSGVQRYGSLMSGANQPPPGGASSQQTGLVRSQGTLSTTVALAAGQYSLSFQMANRSNYGGQQAVQVRVAGTPLPGSYTPSTSFASYSASFSVAAGNTEIAFVGVNAGDNTALIDNVVLSPVTSSLTPPSGCVITAPTSLVSGQGGSFSVSCSAGSAPLSYAWSRTLTGFSGTAQSFNDTPFSSATTTVASATYSVNVSNAAGNQVAAPINVTNGSFTGPPPSTGAETLTFIHPNVSGSPIMATDAAGNVAWREDYSAFGERTKNAANANAGTAANQQWFIGKPQDTQTGLVYFGQRWYDPLIGRFLGFDPAGVDEDNPHSFNRYSYGNNNPNKYLDPDGRFPILALVYAAPAVAALAARAAPFAQRAVAAAMNTINTVAASPATVPIVEAAASMASGSVNGAAVGVNAGARAIGVAARVDSVIAETLSNQGNFVSAFKLTATELLDAGQKFVGAGAKELGKPGSGVFRSSDGTRGFRIDPGSIQGKHNPNVKHGHLETFTAGKAEPASNNHIPFTE